jgi:hypothetical protein
MEAKRVKRSLCRAWKVTISLALMGAACGPVRADGRVEIVADLLEAFGAAQVTNCSSCEVRRPAQAGGVKQDGLFEHPLAPARPARVTFALHLPRLEAAEVLLLAFDVALADGVRLGRGEDGVRFGVEVDDMPVFARASHETRWESHAVDFTPFNGRTVRLTLVVEPGGNTAFDWATWGSPRVLRLRQAGAAKPAEPGKVASPATAGVLALRRPAGAQIKTRLTPIGGGNSLALTPPIEKPGEKLGGWLVQDFNFPGATGVEVDWTPRDALAASNAWLAVYPAQLQLTQLSATRAIITTGETATLRVEVKNAGRGKLAAGEARVQLEARTPLPEKPVPDLAPGETWRGEWDWKAPADGVHSLKAQVLHPQVVAERRTEVEVFEPVQAGEEHVVQNEHLKIEFVRQAGGFAYAKLLARQQAAWAQVAAWRPLFRIAQEAKGKDHTWEPRPPTPSALRENGRDVPNAVLFVARQADADGVEWEARLSVRLEPGAPVARLHYEWKAAKERRVRALWGPNLYVAEGSVGDAKTWGLFPGLEYLFGGEPSSNPRDFTPKLADRRTPHPHKITVPLMAVTFGPDSQRAPEKPSRFFAPDSLKDLPPLPGTDLKSQISSLKSDVTVALLWDPLQKWDGTSAFPSARFAAPNFDEGMNNHRLGLFLPSVPEFVPENAEHARQPYKLPAGQSLSLEATLFVAPGPATVALRQWIKDRGGVPKPPPWPRSFQEELDVCRAGFLRTVWDEKAEKWRHIIGGGGAHAPGFAALLWLDARVAKQAEARRQSRERVELAARNMLREGGPGLFVSQAGCHIMQWEFPFLFGHLPEAMAGLEGQIRHLIQSQRPESGWLHQLGGGPQADLGQESDSVLGTCAQRAMTLLRYARVTGDAEALAAGEKALRFMERFRVPRGGQTWECPMYEPDILPAGYAIRAYLDAYRVTRNPRWLHDAVYWAETGVPFVYLWGLPDRPMMLGAAIPVFGSTFYSHSWLGMPVQWCGLVYAYHLFQLAEALEQTPLTKSESPLPLGLEFTAADWKRIVELITVSAMYQQFADGERIGTYPDSISEFQRRNPAFINPEDILVNVLALQGHDPDIQTARVKTAGGEVVVSSGARIENLLATAGGLRFGLHFFAGENSHVLISGWKPREVRVGGKSLPPSATPMRRDPGWWWDEKKQRLYLCVPHPEAVVPIEIARE